MKRLVLSILFVLAFLAKARAQDLIYTTGGNKMEAKVLEINTVDVKYKDLHNLEGPTYVISKTEVVLIKFSDGSVQIVNDNPPALVPKTAETKPVKPGDKLKKLNLYYLNKNLISINALALANGDVTLLYDREFLDSKLCLSFLGGYNFNPQMGGLNAVILDSWGHAKKNYDAGLGISYMPRNTRRVQYFVGLLGKYMSYDYESVTYTGNQSVIAKSTGSQLAIMVNNGWFFRISPNFNFKIFGSFGVPIYNPSLKQNLNINIPKVYLGYCFGYRF